MAGKARDYRSPLGRARGLGSAKEGVQHWWAQRLTALALVPLAVWFVVSVIVLQGATQAELAAWLSSPFQAGLMILFIVATFWHAALGLQVVIEDYVHREGGKLLLIVLVKGLCALLAIAGVLAVVKLMLQG